LQWRHFNAVQEVRKLYADHEPPTPVYFGYLVLLVVPFLQVAYISKASFIISELGLLMNLVGVLYNMSRFGLSPGKGTPSSSVDTSPHNSSSPLVRAPTPRKPISSEFYTSNNVVGPLDSLGTISSALQKVTQTPTVTARSTTPPHINPFNRDLRGAPIYPPSTAFPNKGSMISFRDIANGSPKPAPTVAKASPVSLNGFHFSNQQAGASFTFSNWHHELASDEVVRPTTPPSPKPNPFSQPNIHHNVRSYKPTNVTMSGSFVNKI